MQKRRGLLLFTFVLVGIMLIMPFASAFSFSDVGDWFKGMGEKLSGKVTGKVVYDSSNSLYNNLIHYYDFNDGTGANKISGVLVYQVFLL